MKHAFEKAVSANDPSNPNRVMWVFDEEKAMAAFINDAYVVRGIVRWSSNDSVPPRDVMADWDSLGVEFDYWKSVAVREDEVCASLKEYSNRSPSPEDMSEMRAAFGEGANVVNIISGAKICL